MTADILRSYASIRQEKMPKRLTRMQRIRNWYWASDTAKAMTASGIVGAVLAVAFIYTLLQYPSLQIHY
jgi:hypothetical protein